MWGFSTTYCHISCVLSSINPVTEKWKQLPVPPKRTFYGKNKSGSRKKEPLSYLSQRVLIFAAGAAAGFAAGGGMGAADAFGAFLLFTADIEDNGTDDGGHQDNNDKIGHGIRPSGRRSDDNGFRQLGVDVVAPILDGNHAAASAPGNHGDGLAAVAAQGEEEGVQLLVIGVDALDNVFGTKLCVA